jgi:K+-transporting ATPase ATPase B chain
MADETPEGKSIIELAGINPLSYEVKEPQFISFTAETRSSGIDYENTRIRKGATDAIKNIVTNAGNTFPTEVAERVREISQNGGTPLVVSENEKAWGYRITGYHQTGNQRTF